ncbi:SigE family RNA polymerase sigma factor [Kitasatospora sp. NPDC048365]|uniref:SigE family RNA polymerase sigma factor n=1 Tax=Kitasatospora sp. NPDC048365 TaxID=3364050 RepID=UPI003711266E
MTEELDFDEFAAGRANRLFQAAYLMCGDWHQAQDLVQTTLSKLYPVWGRLTRKNEVNGLDAYARKVLLRTYLDHRRLRRSSEIAVPEIADRPVPGTEESRRLETRIALLDALGQLSPRSRAVVVMRYLDDCSVETVAEAVGISQASVKTISFRGLAKLREILGPERTLLLQD